MRSLGCSARNCFVETTSLKPDLMQTEGLWQAIDHILKETVRLGDRNLGILLANREVLDFGSFSLFSIDQKTLKCVASCLAVNQAAWVSDARKYEPPRDQYLHDTNDQS